MDAMEKSASTPAKVYFTNLRTHGRESQLDKLKRLIKRAGIGQIDFTNKIVAIKIHFGELGNLSFLRPNYARAVADVVKELGGKPFLTDCNTLYVGSRKNALEHIDCAYQNGFTPYATGCHVIITDGLKGTDEALVPDVGMFASFDPVAIDQACIDAVLAQPAMPDTELTESRAKLEAAGVHLDEEHAHDHFYVTHPDTDWKSMIEHGEKIGLGTNKYELIEVK